MPSSPTKPGPAPAQFGPLRPMLMGYGQSSSECCKCRRELPEHDRNRSRVKRYRPKLTNIAQNAITMRKSWTKSAQSSPPTYRKRAKPCAMRFGPGRRTQYFTPAKASVADPPQLLTAIPFNQRLRDFKSAQRPWSLYGRLQYACNHRKPSRCHAKPGFRFAKTNTMGRQARPCK